VTGFAPLNALIFAVLGLAVFFAACALAAKAAPLDFWRHIAEERSVAAAIVAGAAMLAMGWIIAAAMH
jgi:hypothetical protein